MKSSEIQGNGKRTLLLGLGLTVGALGGLVIGRRLAVRRQMPYLSRFQRALAEKRGQAEAATLAARAQERYDELHAHRPRFTHRELRQHLEKNILPGLTLYQVLRETEPPKDQDAVLREMEALFEAAFGPSARVMSVLRYLPDPFRMFRRLALWALRAGFPPQGWDIEWVENNDRCLAFDIRRCFYLEVLTAYGASELTSLYCKMDDLMYEDLPPAITWERTKTLGQGDDRCDFRWCRKG